MDITIENKIKIELTAYMHDGILKTCPCDLGKWYGTATSCDRINIDREIEKIKMVAGEYKITITLERQSD